MARLYVLSGALLGRVLDVHDGAVLGRVAAADVTLADPSVSREHARFEAGDDGTWLVTDLGSSNGTLVDGERVGEALLEDGDVFAVGAVELRFRTETPAKGSAKGSHGVSLAAPPVEEASEGPELEFDLAEDEPEDVQELELEYGEELDEALAAAERAPTKPSAPVRSAPSAAPAPRAGRDADRARAARRAEVLGGAARRPPAAADGGRPILQYTQTRSGGTDVDQLGAGAKVLVALAGLAVVLAAAYGAFALTR